MTPAILVFSLFFMTSPDAPPSTWHFDAQYRTELACSFFGTYKQLQLEKQGVKIFPKCVPGLRQ